MYWKHPIVKDLPREIALCPFSLTKAIGASNIFFAIADNSEAMSTFNYNCISHPSLFFKHSSSVNH